MCWRELGARVVMQSSACLSVVVSVCCVLHCFGLFKGDFVRDFMRDVCNIFG